MAPTFWRRVSQDIKREVLAAGVKPRVREWPATGIHATWIGHSTVLLSIHGFTILTDPVLGKRIGLNLGPLTVGFKRLVEPALSLAEIPRPDLILLSHAHMDHFDVPTLRRLEHRETAVITAPNTSDLLRVGRYKSVCELKWNESARMGPLTIRAFEVRHWGARMRNDTHRGYNGYLIETDARRIVFGGDTAFTDSFRALRTSKSVDLAIMPIGAYDPWIAAHCTPEQALTMANDASAEFILPVHHRTFQLSREPNPEPMQRLLAAAASDDRRICVRDFGEEFHLA